MKIYVVTDRVSKEHLLSEVSSKKSKYFEKIDVSVVSSTDKVNVSKFLLILEDDINDFLTISKAAFLCKEFSEVVICDRVSTSLEVVKSLKEAPLLITLDFKIGDESAIYDDTSKIYLNIKNKFPDVEVIGYTNYETPGEDEIGDQAKRLLRLMTTNNESVFDKYSFSSPEALANIFRDKIRISQFKKQNSKITAENEKLKKELKYTDNALPATSGKNYIIGGSLPMRILYKEMQQLKGITPNVLIMGGRGSGKELVAKAIYEDSPLGKPRPYVEINCAQFGDDNNSLISELFGHVKGAFTGAIEPRKGVFEVADNGTVFLDEIGNLSVTAQEKLLRFLETGKFNKLGDDYNMISSKVRLICATNANLEDLKYGGKFRDDFYDRIAVVVLRLPALDERADDINDLADFLISDEEVLIKNFGNSKIKFTISEEAKMLLSKQKFDGNVRDLKNVLIRAMIKARSATNRIDVKHITESLPGATNPVLSPSSDCSEAKSFLDKIQKIVLSNYGSKTKVTQDDIKMHFITVTGQKGVSRKEFIEKYFSPHKDCIRKLISNKDHEWKETVAKCGFIRNVKSKK